MNFNIFRREVDSEKYIIATYRLGSKTTLRDAAWNLAIGQSVGNPNVRNSWETEELFENHSCIVMADEEFLKLGPRGVVKIAFPVSNISPGDGISHLLCMLMGGQMDIDNITECQLVDLKLPDSFADAYKRPQFGVEGIRKFTGQWDKPILGAIVKPKIGITPEILLEMVKQLVEGGVDFIKEDEIMSNPTICPLKERIPLIMDYIKSTGRKVIYAACVNGDYPYVIDRVKRVYEMGGNGVHVNVWNGLGVYRSIRDLDLPLFIHFQKSGDKTFTEANHQYHIGWNVICHLAGLMGVDFIHAGMWGGYSSDDERVLRLTLDTLAVEGVMPALSCGMHPGLVQAISNKFGTDYMANVGGAIHGHPGGTIAGAKAMRQAIDKTGGPEYDQAIEKWGLVE